MHRGLGLNCLNFDLLFIFGRNSQVKHVHEQSKSICITILNLRILLSVVTIGPSQLSILWVMGMKQLPLISFKYHCLPTFLSRRRDVMLENSDSFPSPVHDALIFPP